MDQIKTNADKQLEALEKSSELLVKIVESKKTQAETDLALSLAISELLIEIKHLSGNIKKSNKIGFKFTAMMLLIASLAFSIDVIQIDDYEVIKGRIASAIGYGVGL